MMVFGCFKGYSRLHVYFTDWFFGGLGLGLGLGLRVLVFEITKTKTPKLAVTFDLKLGGKDPTKDNLTHYTYLSYNIWLYISTDLILGGLSSRNLEN